MRIDGLINAGGQAGGAANIKALLDRLNIGDVIKAKVLEMTSGELLLKLFDGTSVKARTEADIDVQPGDLIDLSVSAKKDGTVFLETVKKNDAISEKTRNELKLQLENMNFKADAATLELAGKFRSAGVKMTAELLNKAIDIAESFMNATPDKAAYLASKDLVPDAGKADALFKLLEGRLNIGKQLSDLQRLLSGLITRQESEKTVNSKTLSISYKSNAADDIPIEPGQENTGQINTGAKPNTARNPADYAARQPEGTSDQPGTAVKISRSTTGQQGTAIQRQVIVPEPPKATPAGLQNGTDDVKADAEKLQSQRAIRETKGINIPGKADGPAFGPVQTAIKGLDKGGPELKASAVNDPGFGNTSTDNIADGTTDKKETTHRLNDLFKDIFVKTNSENLKSDLDARKLYREIITRLDDLKTAVKASAIPGNDNIISHIDNIQDGIQLLNQINNSSAYVQIPLNMSGFNTSGELYVMNRERKKGRLDPQDVVMLISLDTQNIGRIESIIDIRGKNVSMNMRSESQRINSFIKENFKKLYDSLLEKGYRLVDIRYRIISEAVTPVNAEQTVKSALEEGKNTLDMRI